jgi:CO dehydrogenase maturation factor
LAAEIGLAHIAVIGNKIRGLKDEDFLKKHLPDFEYLGSIPYDDSLIEADLAGNSPYDTANLSKDAVGNMVQRL